MAESLFPQRQQIHRVDKSKIRVVVSTNTKHKHTVAPAISPYLFITKSFYLKFAMTFPNFVTNMKPSLSISKISNLKAPFIASLLLVPFTFILWDIKARKLGILMVLLLLSESTCREKSRN